MLRKHILATALLAAAGAAQAATITLFATDFSSPDTVYAGVVATPTGVIGTTSGGSLAGFSGSFLWNDSTGNPAASTNLLLSNLPTHTSITVSFRFAFVDSWDSTDGSPSPDWFTLTLDSRQAVHITCNNASGSSCDNGPGTNASGFSNMFGNGNWNDLTRDVSASIAHTGSTLQLSAFAEGAGWQGGSDESWAMDNLLVTAEVPDSAIPEPASLALLGLGFAGLVARRRR